MRETKAVIEAAAKEDNARRGAQHYPDSSSPQQPPPSRCRLRCTAVGSLRLMVVHRSLKQQTGKSRRDDRK